jgi:hypothetical protein
MIWLFLSVVLVLLVTNRGFRKFSLWAGGIAAALVTVLLWVNW